MMSRWVVVGCLAISMFVGAGLLLAATPGDIMMGEVQASFNDSLFFLVLLSVVCFLAAIISVLKKEFAVAGMSFVAGMFAIGMTSCVNRMSVGIARAWLMDDSTMQAVMSLFV